MTAGCEDCGRTYGDEHGFPDLVVPHDVWELLMPGRSGGGLLCPSCICKRAHDAGVRGQAVFRSGPFADHEAPMPSPDRQFESGTRYTADTLVGSTCGPTGEPRRTFDSCTCRR